MLCSWERKDGLKPVFHLNSVKNYWYLLGGRSSSPIFLTQRTQSSLGVTSDEQEALSVFSSRTINVSRKRPSLITEITSGRAKFETIQFNMFLFFLNVYPECYYISQQIIPENPPEKNLQKPSRRDPTVQFNLQVLPRKTKCQSVILGSLEFVRTEANYPTLVAIKEDTIIGHFCVEE